VGQNKLTALRCAESLRRPRLRTEWLRSTGLGDPTLPGFPSLRRRCAGSASILATARDSAARTMVRMKDGVLIGHASITGSPIVRGDARAFAAIVRNLGREH
jgi:hypothetical protein